MGLETADVAWAAGYFDGDDGDGGSFPLSERQPALAGSAPASAPLLVALVAPAARPRAAGLRVAPAGVCFRAPPLA